MKLLQYFGVKFVWLTVLSILWAPLWAQLPPRFSDGSVPENVGMVDPDFSLSHLPNGDILAIDILLSGEVLIGGRFTKVGNIEQSYLALYTQEGQFIPEFDPDLDGPVHTIWARTPTSVFIGGSINMIVEPGEIVVGGDFHMVNGKMQRGIAAFLRDGSDDPTSHFGVGFDGPVYAIAGEAFQHDPVFIGGAFSSFRGMPASNLIRTSLTSQQAFTDLKADGPILTIARPGPGWGRSEVALVGGSFSKVDGQDAANIAAVDSFSGLTLGIDMGGFDGPVRQVIVHGDLGDVVTALGDFTSFNGSAVGNLVSFHPGVISLQQAPELRPFPNLPESTATSLGVGGKDDLLIGYEDGTVRQLLSDSSMLGRADWILNEEFAGILPTGAGAVRCFFQEWSANFSHNKWRYLAGTAAVEDSAEVVRLFGLHGSSIPPAPNLAPDIFSDRVRVSLPKELNSSPVEIQLSSDDGETWRDLSRRFGIASQIGLKPETPYLFRARYYNSNGMGAYFENSFETQAVTDFFGKRIPLPKSRIYSAGGGRPLVSARGDILASVSNANDLALFDPLLRKVDCPDLSKMTIFDTTGNLVQAKQTGKTIHIIRNDIETKDETRFDFEIDDGQRLMQIFAKKSGKGLWLILLSANGAEGLLLAGVSFEGQLDSTPPLILSSGSIDDLEESSQGELILTGGFYDKINEQRYTGVRLSSSKDVLYRIEYSAANAAARSIELGADGHLLLAYSHDFNGKPLKRLLEDGLVDPGFQPKFTYQGSDFVVIDDIAVTRTGQILVAGIFDHCEGVPVASLVRLNEDGSVDLSFRSNLVGEGTVYRPGSLLVLPDDSVVVKGYGYEEGTTSSIIFFDRLRGENTLPDRELWAKAWDLESFDPTSDTDADGLPLELEFAYNRNPKKRDYLRLLSLKGRCLQVEPPMVPGVSPKVLFSSDLKTWSEVSLDGNWQSKPNAASGFFQLEKKSP